MDYTIKAISSSVCRYWGAYMQALCPSLHAWYHLALSQQSEAWSPLITILLETGDKRMWSNLPKVAARKCRSGTQILNYSPLCYGPILLCPFFSISTLPSMRHINYRSMMTRCPQGSSLGWALTQNNNAQQHKTPKSGKLLHLSTICKSPRESSPAKWESVFKRPSSSLTLLPKVLLAWLGGGEIPLPSFALFLRGGKWTSVKSSLEKVRITSSAVSVTLWESS